MILVRRLDSKFTAWLSRIGRPEICFAVEDGLLTTRFFTEQYPEYCKVAPSKESNRDPKKPPKQPIKMIGHWGVMRLI